MTVYTILLIGIMFGSCIGPENEVDIIIGIFICVMIGAINGGFVGAIIGITIYLLGSFIGSVLSILWYVKKTTIE